MRILVTGANGFIGRYLCKKLESDGHEVLKHSRDQGDLREARTLKQYEGVDIDVVVHLAARAYVPESWNKPGDYINDNIVMLVNILEMCRLKKTKIVFMSTYLYGTPDYLPIDEKHKCNSSTPYHLSKRMGEEICETYSTYYGVDTIILRPFNVYGLGQKPDYLIPRIYYQIRDNSTDVIEVMDLSPRRDYVYVEDLVNIIAQLASNIVGFEIYNVGSGISYSVQEVIDVMQSEFGTNKHVVEKKSVRKNEIMDCVADISRIRKAIDNLSMTTFGEGIHKWHINENRAEYSIRGN